MFAAGQFFDVEFVLYFSIFGLLLELCVDLEVGLDFLQVAEDDLVLAKVALHDVHVVLKVQHAHFFEPT